MRTCRRGMSALLPPVHPEERYEAHGPDIRRLDGLTLSHDEPERLLLLRADGHEHAAAARQLIDEGLRNGRAASADEDRVIGRILAPADSAVAEQHGHVLRPDAGD